MMQLSPGWAIGPYRLTEPTGAGGMAQVWRAYDTRLERYVAMKFISPQFATDPAYLDRFRREARAISRLDHPNILSIYDFGEQDGWTFMVSAFVGGGTLAARLRRGPWTVPEAIAVLDPLASALDYAHAEGIVHRDVKPSNVLMTERERVVLSDFGIAKVLEESSMVSMAGLIVGTPMYMSPEQAEGLPAGPGSDLYSLGVVAYEMLTGRPPYLGETPLALLRAHVDKPLPPPRSLNTSLSEGVETVLFKIMAKSPSDRFQSGEAFVTALRAAVERPVLPASQVVQLAPSLTDPSPRQPATPAPTTPTAGSSIVPSDSLPMTRLASSPPSGSERTTTAATAGLTQPTAGLMQPPGAKPQPPTAPISPGRPSLSSRSDSDLAGAPQSTSRRKLLLGMGIVAVGGIGGFLALRSPASNSSSAQAVTPTPAQGSAGSAPATPRVNPTLSPSVAAPSPAVVASEAPNFALTHTLNGVLELNGIAFSPDGALVAAASELLQTMIWNVGDGSKLRQIGGGGERRETVRLSPDGRFVLVGTPAGARLSKVDDGSDVREFVIAPNKESMILGDAGALFSPDGAVVAVWGTNARFISLMRTGDGSKIGELSARDAKGERSMLHDATFSSDGQQVLAASTNGAVYIWRVSELGSPRTIRLKSTKDDVSRIAIAPDGQLFAVALEDSTVRLIRTADGEQVTLLRGHTDDVSALAFSPDGKLLATGSRDTTARVWRTDSSNQSVQLSGHTKAVTGVAFTADGRTLGTSSEDGTVKLWRAQ